MSRDLTNSACLVPVIDTALQSAHVSRFFAPIPHFMKTMDLSNLSDRRPFGIDETNDLYMKKDRALFNAHHFTMIRSTADTIIWSYH
jgi:hypothetical protein